MKNGQKKAPDSPEGTATLECSLSLPLVVIEQLKHEAVNKHGGQGAIGKVIAEVLTQYATPRPRRYGLLDD